jgi:hypothetical protein
VREEAEHNTDSDAVEVGARRCRDAEGVSVTRRESLAELTVDFAWFIWPDPGLAGAAATRR